MEEPIIIISYDPNWKQEFCLYADRIRNKIGSVAKRIDHIGSTSIDGLDAKPIIDIQISIESFEIIKELELKMKEIGFIYKSNNPDLSKKYFREKPGQKRVHIHFRKEGSWSEQFALLFRDYLRAHPDDCKQKKDIGVRSSFLT